jgi:hypothetical protein
MRGWVPELDVPETEWRLIVVRRRRSPRSTDDPSHRKCWPRGVHTYPMVTPLSE